jgi:hypothetical protein
MNLTTWILLISQSISVRTSTYRLLQMLQLPLAASRSHRLLALRPPTPGRNMPTSALYCEAEKPMVLKTI